MKFSIDKKIFEEFPLLNIGVIIAKEINNEGEDAEIFSMQSATSNIIRADFSLETFKDEPKINNWREAYKTFGAKPKKYSSSIENLVRMILEGIDLRSINKVVDIYNYISLKYIVPVGGDDIDKIDGDIVLHFAKGNEPFKKLNSDEIDNPKEGEVIYSDDKEVLCRRWNWRECDKTKMTQQTKNIMLVVEGIPPLTDNEIIKITDELGSLIKKFCGGEILTFHLNIEKQEIEF